MEPARHLEIIRAEGVSVAATPVDALGASIPTVAEWTVEGVVRHLGKVHQWVTTILALSPGQALDEAGPLPGMPKGPDCLAAYAESHAAMVAAFEGLDPDEERVNFGGAGTVGWWMRRQAQETSVHRIDVADGVHAAGGPTPEALPADAAADGIDEWARFFLAVRWPQRNGALPEDLHGRTIHIHGTDDPAPADGAEWLLSLGADGIDIEATHAKGDVALRGSSSDLLLALWRRRSLDDLDVVGDRSVAERLLDVARF